MSPTMSNNDNKSLWVAFPDIKDGVTTSYNTLQPNQHKQQKRKYHPLLEMQTTMDNISENIVEYQNSVGQLYDSYRTTPQNVARAKDLQVRFQNIQRQMNDLDISQNLFAKQGYEFQKEAAHTTNELDSELTILNTKYNQIIKIQNEINAAIGTVETDQLQMKSYWMQGTILLVIVIILIWRVFAATMRDKTGEIDIIIVVVGVLVILYYNWFYLRYIGNTLVSIWSYLKRTIFNINI